LRRGVLSFYHPHPHLGLALVGAVGGGRGRTVCAVRRAGMGPRGEVLTKGLVGCVRLRRREYEHEHEYGHEPEPERVDWVGLRQREPESESEPESTRPLGRSLDAHVLCRWAFEARRGFFSFFIFSRLRRLAFSRSGVLDFF
jgi:hypothetical protein